METRRAFLAELGVGLSSLLLPSVAQACWWRRRRCRAVCCPPPRPPQPLLPKACPQSIYGQSDGVWWYHCIYASDCRTTVNASSPNLISVPQPCPNGNCIPVGAFAGYDVIPTPPPDQSFKPHQRHHFFGAPYIGPKEDFRLQDPASFDKRSALVWYEDRNKQKRYAKLFRIQHKKDKEILLRVGQEMDPAQGSAEKAARFKWSHFCHHIVEWEGELYHILAHKP